MNKNQWETTVSLFRNPFILKGLVLSFALPLVIILSIILILTKGDIIHSEAKFALLFIVVFFVLSFIFVLFIYGGKYSPGYVIDEKGITGYSQEKVAQTNKTVNKLLFYLGILRENITAVSIGLMAQGRKKMTIHWDSVRKIKFYPRQNAIVIKGGFGEKMSVFCTSENYMQIEDIIKSRVKIFFNTDN